MHNLGRSLLWQCGRSTEGVIRLEAHRPVTANCPRREKNCLIQDFGWLEKKGRFRRSSRLKSDLGIKEIQVIREKEGARSNPVFLT